MPNKQFYKSKKWQKVRELVILRDKDICYFCNQLILKRRTIHHLEEINELNITDENITLNMDNLKECHDYCHNIHHDRFGFKNTIVDTNLEINYNKRNI